MARIRLVSDVPTELAPLFAEAKLRGTPTEKFLRAMASNPAVLTAWAGLWRQVFWEGRLAPELKEKVRLYIARQFACSN